ncbi:PEP-CTERM sorting domain-containing protein [Kiritimatiellaeota bacterium B1221]|nr:PEP-CTERM sorting domain-containing protein [Kiritimatiellaeota bacterium B1221]
MMNLRRLLPAFSILSLCFLSASGLQAAVVTTPYSNDFSSSVADFTENDDPNWSLVSGTYQYFTSLDNNAGSAMVTATGLGATYEDFVVSTTFEVTSKASGGVFNWGMALLGNDEDPGTYILADLSSGGGIRLINVGGSGTGNDVNETGSFSYALNTSYTLTATGTYVGSDLTLKLDITNGVSSTSITAAAFDASTYYTGAAMGLRARSGSGGGTTVQYDSFTIIPEPSTFSLMAGFCLLGYVMLRRR